MNWLDPLHWMTDEKYNELMAMFGGHLFGGVGVRLITFLLLVMAVWFVIRKKNIPVGFICFGICVITVFGSWFSWAISYLTS